MGNTWFVVENQGENHARARGGHSEEEMLADYLSFILRISYFNFSLLYFNSFVLVFNRRWGLSLWLS